jgi:hypothetical protein
LNKFVIRSVVSFAASAVIDHDVVAAISRVELKFGLNLFGPDALTILVKRNASHRDHPWSAGMLSGTKFRVVRGSVFVAIFHVVLL